MIYSYCLKVDGRVITWDKQFPMVSAVNGWLTPIQQKAAINLYAEQEGISPNGITLHRNKPRAARLNEIDWTKPPKKGIK